MAGYIDGAARLFDRERERLFGVGVIVGKAGIRDARRAAVSARVADEEAELGREAGALRTPRPSSAAHAVKEQHGRAPGAPLDVYQPSRR